MKEDKGVLARNECRAQELNVHLPCHHLAFVRAGVLAADVEKPALRDGRWLCPKRGEGCEYDRHEICE